MPKLTEEHKQMLAGLGKAINKGKIPPKAITNEVIVLAINELSKRMDKQNKLLQQIISSH